MCNEVAVLKPKTNTTIWNFVLVFSTEREIQSENRREMYERSKRRCWAIALLIKGAGKWQPNQAER